MVLDFVVGFLAIVSIPAVWISCSLVSDFICVVVASLARQIARAFYSGRSASLSNLLRIPSLFTPSIMRSLIKMSVSSPNSQVLALVRKSVTKWSMDSPGSWFLVLKNMSFPGDILSRITVGFKLCHYWLHLHFVAVMVPLERVVNFNGFSAGHVQLSGGLRFF